MTGVAGSNGDRYWVRQTLRPCQLGTAHPYLNDTESEAEAALVIPPRKQLPETGVDRSRFTKPAYLEKLCIKSATAPVL